MKQGHPLAQISAFSAEVLSKLRSELSVTTAEEFVDLSHRLPTAIKAALAIDHARFETLVEASRAVLSKDELGEIEQPPGNLRILSTGFEPPSNGETYYKGEGDDRSKGRPHPVQPDSPRKKPDHD
jgi:hypothetical protein